MATHVPSDFFTRELDNAILNKQADIAIHSAKDLPYPLPAGLAVFCLTEGLTKTDSLVSRDRLTLAQLPQGARVGTSSPTRKRELLKIRPDLTIVSIRGTIQERIEQVETGHIDALVVATCALMRLNLEHLISEELCFDTHPLQGNLAIVGRSCDHERKAFFAQHDIRKQYGKVSLVGFGTGNPEWLTIEANRLLEEATQILFDDLTNHSFLEKYLAKKVYVGKRKGAHSLEQDAINSLMYRLATQGERVVRLKGGDPMIFAHGREEIDFLESRLVEVHVVPGITSALAFAATTHIPLTHRGMASSVAFVTGHTPENINQVKADTLVIYMGGTHLKTLAHNLLALNHPKEKPVALAHALSTPQQRIFLTTLGELQYTAPTLPTPLLIVVGDVVGLGLSDGSPQQTLYTGTTPPPVLPPNQRYVHTSVIQVDFFSDAHTRSRLIHTLKASPYIVFTSRYGVESFHQLLKDSPSLSILPNKKVISVGPTTTQSLIRHGISPFFESPTESATGIVTFFAQQQSKQEQILLPRSVQGIPYLPEELIKQGYTVHDVAVYGTSPNPLAQKVDLNLFNKIVFSSPSCVKAFVLLYGQLPTHCQLVARGESTYQELIKNIQ